MGDRGNFVRVAGILQKQSPEYFGCHKRSYVKDEPPCELAEP